jgi:TonB family protein
MIFAARFFDCSWFPSEINCEKNKLYWTLVPLESPKNTSEESDIMMPLKRLHWAFAVSLLAHSVLSWLTWSLKEPSKDAHPNQGVWVEILEKPPVEPAPKMQIVEQSEKPLNSEIDPRAQFLSQFNQRVEKQTRAEKRGEFRNSSGKGLGAFLPQFNAPQAAEQSQKRDEEQEALLQMRLQENLKSASNPADNPSSESSNDLVSQTLDYIKELDPGLESLLSTREFLYFSYYKRIRQQLQQYWNPEIQKTLKQLYASGRQLASSDDRITKCLVTLDSSGRLLRVQIIGQSGVRDLDEAAVRAFRSASPFPNPPKGMMDSEGNIQIRWDFILEA